MQKGTSSIMTNPNFNDPSHNPSISEALREIFQRKDEYEKTRVRIGIIGESGSGKSSMINAICGEYIAPVGVVETTKEPQAFEVPNSIVTYFDLPGCGTERWPAKTYVEDLNLLTDYDAFIFVNRGRILQHDQALYRELTEGGRTVFIARNFFDAAINGELGKPEDLRRDESQLRNQIVQDFRKQFDSPHARVFLTATTPGAPTFELPALQEALIDELNTIHEFKAMRFAASTKAYTREMLDHKTAVAKKIVHLYAATAAAASAVPIPGVGIAADISTVIAMNLQVANCFNIDVESDDPRVMTTVGPLLSGLQSYMSREGVILLLKPMAGRSFLKESSKFIPIFGSAVAAATSAGMVEFLGRQAIRDFHKAASAILESAV